MGNAYGPEPGSAARTAENEPRPVVQRIEGGSAAKAAEESARNSREVSQEEVYRGSVGFNLRASTRAKFEFPSHPEGPGEAVPLARKEEPAMPPQAKQPEDARPANASAKETTTGIKGFFRRLFRR